MRERLWILGVCGLLGLSSAVSAHEESTTPPSPEGGGRPLPAASASPRAAPSAVRAPLPAPSGAVVKPARASGAGKATTPPAGRPLRLSLDASQRLAPTPPPSAQHGDAEPAPPEASAAPAAARPSTPGSPGEAAAPKVPTLKLAPSAKEIESERQTVLKPKVEPRPDQYENQRPDIPAPTQVRRVPGPGSSVGSTASDRKATMLDNSGPQQNSTYRRW